MSIVFVTDNPLDADEIVYVAEDDALAEDAVYVKCTPYKTDKKIYIVEPTPEMRDLEQDVGRLREAMADTSRLRTFSYRNAGFHQIDRIVRIVASADEASASSPT